MTFFRIPSFYLNGKRTLVIGASSGISEGYSVALAEAGTSLLIDAGWTAD